METLAIARKLNRYGFTKLADRLVTRQYGAQIGITSKSGARTFSSKEAKPIFVDTGIRCVDRIDDMAPESVITAIDKDYNLVGQTITRRMYKDPVDITSFHCTQVERRLLPKPNDPLQTHRLDITQYQGLGSQAQPGRNVVSRHYIGRNALAPEVNYNSGDPCGIHEEGRRIYDQFNYSYMPKDEAGNIVMIYGNIGYASGGETFYNKIQQMLKNWYKHYRVIRNTKNSL